MSEQRALVQRAVRGEEDALGRLVSEHRPWVVRTARHLLGDDAAAEDAAQDVFVRMHAALPGFRGDGELGTWLYRVTLNLCRDRMRTARRRRERAEVARAQAAPATGVHPTPELSMDLDRARAAVRKALDRLPPEQREAIALRYLEDLPYAEIARRTGIAQGTIASRVFRGLERLGRELDPHHLEVLR